MGIQSFAGSSSSLPGQTFIDQVYMVYKVRKWPRGGSPGFYRATSALGKDGFIYYLQTNGQLVQAPLNGIADVTLPFTEIRILATQYDMISLFKEVKHITQKSVEDKILVDAAAYANISLGTTTITLKSGETMTVQTTKETKTYYDYEQETNEAKRTIKILKPEFVNKVEAELKRILL
jgi:hypothetical protein